MTTRAFWFRFCLPRFNPPGCAPDHHRPPYTACRRSRMTTCLPRRLFSCCFTRLRDRQNITALRYTSSTHLLYFTFAAFTATPLRCGIAVSTGQQGTYHMLWFHLPGTSWDAAHPTRARLPTMRTGVAVSPPALLHFAYVASAPLTWPLPPVTVAFTLLCCRFWVITTFNYTTALDVHAFIMNRFGMFVTPPDTRSSVRAHLFL